MNLEAIALARAQEQVSTLNADTFRVVEPKKTKKPARKGAGKGRPITCFCGECTKCKRRAWQRLARAKSQKSPRICTIEGCLRHVHTANRCWRHWQQLKKWGTSFPNRRRVASPEFVERVRAKLAGKGIAA